MAERLKDNRVTESMITLLLGFGNSKHCYLSNTYLYVFAMSVRWLEPILLFIKNSYDCATIAYKNGVFPWLKSIRGSRREDAGIVVQIIRVVLVVEGQDTGVTM